jgi:hypothetical protein
LSSVRACAVPQQRLEIACGQRTQMIERNPSQTGPVRRRRHAVELQQFVEPLRVCRKRQNLAPIVFEVDLTLGGHPKQIR